MEVLVCACTRDEEKARECRWLGVKGLEGRSVGRASIENLWEAHRWAASKPSMVTRGLHTGGKRSGSGRERERERQRLEAGIDWNIFINLACVPTV